jgi:ribosomal-protein-alanine N-acetyltransferase
VRKSNLAAQKLYESVGFVATGIRKGYYSDDGEDALAMTLDLASSG